MTTILWCAKTRTLAADRMSVIYGTPHPTTKIRVHGDYVFAGSGQRWAIEIVRRWLAVGAKPTEAPKWDSDEESPCGIAVHVPTAAAYNVEGKTSVLLLIEDPVGFARGSGIDSAFAALHLGRSAREAIELASRLNVDTGLGVDEAQFARAADGSWHYELRRTIDGETRVVGGTRQAPATVASPRPAYAEMEAGKPGDVDDRLPAQDDKVGPW